MRRPQENKKQNQESYRIIARFPSLTKELSTKSGPKVIFNYLQLAHVPMAHSVGCWSEIIVILRRMWSEPGPQVIPKTNPTPGT